MSCVGDVFCLPVLLAVNVVNDAHFHRAGSQQVDLIWCL